MNDCAHVTPLLSQHLDGTLTGDDRARVSAHVASCTACRGLVEDLARLRDAAGTLGGVEPPDHLWLEIAGRIRLDHGSESGVHQAAPAVHRHALVQWVGLAAALIIVTAGVFVVTRTPVVDSQPGNVVEAGSVVRVEEELLMASEHYERAMAELEAMTEGGETALDASVTTALRSTMSTIDGAVSASQTALASDPGNDTARRSLFEALRHKVGLLQATVTLLNEMRKGNQDGAARVAAGAGRSS